MARNLTVLVQSEPHTQDLTNTILLRPAPQGGEFLVQEHVERADFDAARPYGLVYQSADYLEDMDIFNEEPGWRWSLKALAVLVERGYTLTIRKTLVTTVADLHALFTPDAIRAYHEQVKTAKAAAQAQAAEDRRQLQVQRQVDGAYYEAWVAEHTTGLIYTSFMPAQFIGWESIAFFSKEVPGTWHTTGDRWSRLEINGVLVLRKDYGNAVVFYAPQDLIDQWLRADWETTLAAAPVRAQAAQSILRRAYEFDRPVMFADQPKRLIELYGVEYFVAIAREAVWLYTAVNLGKDTIPPIAERLGIPTMFLEYVSMLDSGRSEAVRKLTHPTAIYDEQPDRCSSIYYSETDHHYYGETYHYNYFRLTKEQQQSLGL